VDSGHILISDPSYINNVFSIEGDDIDAILPEIDEGRCRQITTEWGTKKDIPIAMTLQTGWGDGVYPVTAHYNRDGRIAKVEITFEQHWGERPHHGGQQGSAAHPQHLNQ
jgi:hypothetical protein